MVSRIGKRDKDKKRSSFKYTERSVDDVKKRAEQSGGRFDSPYKAGIDTWRPKAGENLIRILPGTWEGHDHYGLDVFMHRFIGSDNSNYLCLNKMKGKPCPACEEAAAANKAGEADEAKALQPQKRVLVWIIDRDDDSQTPQVWDMSWSQDRDIAALCHDKRKGKVLLIDHPTDGYDLVVKRTGQGLKTKYQYVIDREPSEIDDDQDKMDEILDFISENPLTEVLRYDTAEHIEKALSGTAPSKDKDLDEDEDEKPKRRGRGKPADDDEDEDEKPTRRSRVKRDADEDEDEEEEKPKRRGRKSDDDEDEEEEKPKKRRRPADDDEDEEEEKPKRRRSRDDDEDEEEEKPKRRRVVDDEDEEEEKPKKRRRVVEDDDEEDEPKPKKRKPADDDDDEEEEKPRRRSKPADDDDDEDEEEEKPRRRRR
jgi:hypothetical protein